MEACPSVYSMGPFCESLSTSAFCRVVRNRGWCLSRHFLVRAIIPENYRVWIETKIIGLNSPRLSLTRDSLSNAQKLNLVLVIMKIESNALQLRV